MESKRKNDSLGKLLFNQTKGKTLEISKLFSENNPSHKLIKVEDCYDLVDVPTSRNFPPERS